MKWTGTSDSRIKKREGIYWARFSRKGRRIEVSLETKNFTVAKLKTDEIDAKAVLGRSWKRERQLFEDAWIEFMIDKRNGNKVKPAREKTLREYAGFGERYYLPFFKETRLGDLEDRWPEFVEWFKVEHPDVLFFNVRKYMAGFTTWAVAHGKITEKPYLLDLDAKKAEEREEFTPGKAYSRAELEKFREASAAHPQFHLFMLMLQFQGMRPSEITQLKKSRIDLGSRIIRLKRADTKTKRGRVVPIHPEVEGPLKCQMLASKSEFLFPHAHVRLKANSPMDRNGFKKIWESVREKVGVEGRLYDFRHTFITHAISSGVNPAAVAMVTGTSLRIIEKYYLHLSNADLYAEIRKVQL